MKILCVIDSLCCGGAQRQLCELALGFKQRGNNVSFLVYHNIPFFHPFLGEAGIAVTCIEESNYFLRILKIRRFIRSGKFDVVLSFLEAPSFICEISGLPTRKWKLIVGERNSDPGIKGSLKLRIYRWFHLFADYVVANSYSNLRLVYSVCPSLPAEKGVVIYNMIDIDKWKPQEGTTLKTDSIFRIVIAARQSYQKNLEGLVDAVALLPEKDRHRLRIEWYGNGLEEPFRDLSFIKARDKIDIYGLNNVFSFLPATTDIVSIIQNADAVALFSLYEGFPNAVIEGMACGKPIVCSAVSDIPMIIEYDNKLLCNPMDTESIRDSIHYIMNLSAEQLKQIGQRNKMIAVSRFNRDSIISHYLDLFRRSA